MSLRKEQCNKVCRILDDVLANRPTERDSLIVAVRKAFAQLATDTNVGTKLGTNLAEVGTDCISRQSAIDALRDYLIEKRCPDDGTLTCRLIENEVINKLPSAQPEPYTDALKAEIKRMKRSFTICINSDYYTGYMSALSVVEGYIAQMEVTT